MKEWRFISGIGFTAAWLIFMGYMLSTQSHPSTLDAWGNFFAGFFAPIAFLWLVLGYLQQGEELRHSSHALQLQAQELKNSVEQQSQLVEVSRAQMQHELQAIQEQRNLRREAAKPKFVVRHAGLASGSSGFIANLQIFNVGNTATNLLLELCPPIDQFSRQGIDIIERNKAAQVALCSTSAFNTLAAISYSDADGDPGRAEFSLGMDNSGQLEIGKIKRVD